MVEVKQNSKAALMLKEMLTGYKVKDRFRELHDTYNFKQRNVALRRTIDQDLQHAQEQVIHYLRDANRQLQIQVMQQGESDRQVITSVFKEEKPLRLELQRKRLHQAIDLTFDKYCDAKKVLELLRNLRRERVRKLNKRLGDLKYLSSLGLDAKDAQLAKQKAHIESQIAHWDVKLTTAKFLHDKYSQILPQLVDDQSKYTAKLEAVKLALQRNQDELIDLRTIREEAKTTSKFYIAQLIKVDKQTTKSRTRRDEQLAATTRQHAQMRVDFLRERERRASTDLGSHIATERVPELQKRILAAKVDILRYAEMFQGIRKQTMVEAQDTVARIVTQTDIFDELRQRRDTLESRQAALNTEYDELLVAETEAQFGGTGHQLLNRCAQIDRLKKKMAQLRDKRNANEAKLRASGDVKIQMSRGVEALFNKLRRQLANSSPELTGVVSCDDCTRLTLCAARLERLISELADQHVFRDILAKMQCTLFQEPLEEFTNQPPVQPHMLPRPLSAEQIDFESNVSGVLTREEMKKKSDKLYKSKQRIRIA